MKKEVWTGQQNLRNESTAEQKSENIIENKRNMPLELSKLRLKN